MIIGFAVAVYGGTLRDSFITDNTCSVYQTGTVKAPLGAVYVGGGSMINCTMRGNTSFSGSGIHASSGSVVNSISSGNTATYDDATIATWSGTASLFSHCLGETLINEDCFAEAESVTFGLGCKLKKASLAIDNGLDGTDTSTLDYLGRKRVVGGAIDIGCMEHTQVGAVVIFR